MNVLQIRGSFEDNGPGSQALTIADELKRRGFNVSFCTGGGVMVDVFKKKGFSVHIIEEMTFEKRNPLNILITIFKLRKYLKTGDFEVIHAHNAATLYLAFISYMLCIGIKHIKFFHSCRGVELRKWYQWRNFIYLRYPAHLFAVCNFTKEKLKSFGVPDSKITVTYNGVDTRRFDLNSKEHYRIEIRNEFNIPMDAFVVGIIGRMQVKGHDLLIEAFSKLYDQYRFLYIVLVGEGPDFIKNQTLAKVLGVSDRTIFTGFRTDSEKLNAAFDVFTLLSTYGEMFPNAILESMAYKHPFVASNLSGIPEMATNNEGFLVEVGNVSEIVMKLKILIENNQLRLEMGNNAYKSIINKFNIISVVDKIIEKYNE